MPFDAVRDEFDSRATIEPLRTGPSQEGPTVFVDERSPKTRLTPAWMSRVESLPPHYRQAAAQVLAEQHLEEVLGLQLADAERLGSLFARATNAAATVVRHARGEWLVAFVRGCLRDHSENAALLRFAAGTMKPTRSSDDVGAYPELLAALSEAGDTRSFDLLERTLVAYAGHPELSLAASRFRRAGLGCVQVHSTNKDRQPAADVAVGLVEGLLAVGQYGEVDTVLAEVDVQAIPIEVVLAFLLTAKRAREHLVTYDTLGQKLVQCMRESHRSDVDDVVALLA